jgi:hypothetical protein
MNHPSKFDPRGIVPEGKKWKKRKPIQDLLGKHTVRPDGNHDMSCQRPTGPIGSIRG